MIPGRHSGRTNYIGFLEVVVTLCFAVDRGFLGSYINALLSSSGLYEPRQSANGLSKLPHPFEGFVIRYTQCYEENSISKH